MSATTLSALFRTDQLQNSVLTLQGDPQEPEVMSLHGKHSSGTLWHAAGHGSASCLCRCGLVGNHWQGFEFSCEYIAQYKPIGRLFPYMYTHNRVIKSFMALSLLFSVLCLVTLVTSHVLGLYWESVPQLALYGRDQLWKCFPLRFSDLFPYMTVTTSLCMFSDVETGVEYMKDFDRLIRTIYISSSRSSSEAYAGVVDRLIYLPKLVLIILKRLQFFTNWY